MNMNGYNAYRSSETGRNYQNTIPSQPMYNHMNFPTVPFVHQGFHQPYLYPGQQFSNGYQAYGGYNPSSMYNPQGNEFPIQQQLFQNPLQPAKPNELNSYKPYSNPYPKSNYNVKPPTGGMNSIINSFKSQDGSIDFNKMVNTAGQMMNAVTQVSTMVKGLGGLFKP